MAVTLTKKHQNLNVPPTLQGSSSCRRSGSFLPVHYRGLKRASFPSRLEGESPLSGETRAAMPVGSSADIGVPAKRAKNLTKNWKSGQQKMKSLDAIHGFQALMWTAISLETLIGEWENE
ncbi:hypothetical protein QJS10_CPA16g00645 [Acorus calamus]|uniref:Uncharacterized protein n=1 Tax=Acorus calamus TaxID=4465 RepID=A0AAV9D3W7_ACOCL|nr:hypothetical protein QJS10_CPA16g00645 [Acorus calamus]